MTKKWQKLRAKICEPQDTTLYDEAIKCLEVKAYRMAYVAAWLSIAESIKNKFRKMAEKDQVADAILREIEKLEQEHKPADRFILDKARELGILNEPAYQQLENIFKMRNLFAHPYHLAPTKEEVTAAIVAAIDKVLAIPPLLRKPYIDSLIEKLQKNRHFIDDLEEKVVSFANDTINRIAPDLHPYLIKKLLYALNNVINDPDLLLYSNRLLWFTRACVKQIKPDFSQTDWRLQDKLHELPMAASKTFATPDLWPLIPEDIQDGILSYLLYPEIDGKITTPEGWAVNLIFELARHGKLTNRQAEKLNAVLDSISVDKLAKIGIPIKYYVQRLIDNFTTYSWPSQNISAETIWIIGPKALNDIETKYLENLGRNILQSAHGNAWKSIDFINNTLASNHKWPASFVKGLLFECFVNEKNELRCKCSYLREVTLITIRNNDGDSRSLLESLVQSIKNAKPKSIFNKDDVIKAIEEIDRVIDELTPDELSHHQKVLESLKNSLSQYIKDIREPEMDLF